MCNCGNYDHALNCDIVPIKGKRCPHCGEIIEPGQLPPDIPKPKPEKYNLPEWPKRPKKSEPWITPPPWRKPWYDNRDKYFITQLRS